MKINELQQLSKTLINTADAYFRKRNDPVWDVRVEAGTSLANKLETLGWNPIGMGAYARVFSHPKKKYVIKITSSQDDGYIEYVDLIKQHPNEHFPVISDLKSMKVGNYVYSIYLIEKLSTLRNIDSYNYASDVTEACYTVASWPSSDLKSLFDRDVPKIFIEHPDLVEALKLLGHEIDNHYNICLDLHAGNIMQRANGTIVITDPYA